jgi:single-minded-like protein
VFALHRDGKIMYISETASVLLGLPQIDLTGSSIFDYVHPNDRNDLLNMLHLNEADRRQIQMQLGRNHSSATNTRPEHLELGRSFSLRMKCILPKRNAGLIKNGFKSIHCTGYLKVRRVQKQSQPLLNKAYYNASGVPESNALRSALDNDSLLSSDFDWDSYALVAIGNSLLPTASTEIKLGGNSFMLRANLDMRIFYMETA